MEVTGKDRRFAYSCWVLKVWWPVAHPETLAHEKKTKSVLEVGDIIPTTTNHPFCIEIKTLTKNDIFHATI